jgi:hypothetical protein
LCDPLLQPDPNDLPPGSLDTPPVTAAQTTRQRFQAKIEGKALCATCHEGFADIGYVMESFDALGRFRTVETVFDEETGDLLAELPLDTSGIVRVTLDDERPVAGVEELTERIVESGKVEACLSQKSFAFAMRRLAERRSWDGCAIDAIEARLKNPDEGLAGALRHVAELSSFSLHKVGPQ